jgi:lipoic acid synthetase
MEPENVAKSAASLGLRHVVITSVNRDDLKDFGAGHFAKTIHAVRAKLPECRIEVLIPDFRGSRESLDLIYKAKPDIFNHNIETVERLFPEVAPAKSYRKSLEVLKDAFDHGFMTKTGLILGLGETAGDVEVTLRDLREVGVQMITIGQYLQPTPTHFPVKEYIKPSVFLEYEKFARGLGFRSVLSGPLVRSSYHADEQANPLRT